MPPKEMIQVTYEYLKQGKWKTKTKIIGKEDLENFQKQNKVINYKKIYC